MEKMIKAIMEMFEGTFDYIEARQIARNYEGCSVEFVLTKIEDDIMCL